MIGLLKSKMDIVICGNCSNKVIPKIDGTCPSCRENTIGNSSAPSDSEDIVKKSDTIDKRSCLQKNSPEYISAIKTAKLAWIMPFVVFFMTLVNDSNSISLFTGIDLLLCIVSLTALYFTIRNMLHWSNADLHFHGKLAIISNIYCIIQILLLIWITALLMFT